MSRKEICPDPMLMRSMVYFYLCDEITVRKQNLDMLFSKGYETGWSLNSDNWINCRAFDLEPVDLN